MVPRMPNPFEFGEYSTTQLVGLCASGSGTTSHAQPGEFAVEAAPDIRVDQ